MSLLSGPQRAGRRGTDSRAWMGLWARGVGRPREILHRDLSVGVLLVVKSVIAFVVELRDLQVVQVVFALAERLMMWAARRVLRPGTKRMRTNPW